MGKRIVSVILILVIVVCAGAALWYPVSKYTQGKSNEKTMDELRAMRVSGMEETVVQNTAAGTEIPVSAADESESPITSYDGNSVEQKTTAGTDHPLPAVMDRGETASDSEQEKENIEQETLNAEPSATEQPASDEQTQEQPEQIPDRQEAEPVQDVTPDHREVKSVPDVTASVNEEDDSDTDQAYSERNETAAETEEPSADVVTESQESGEYSADDTIQPTGTKAPAADAASKPNDADISSKAETESLSTDAANPVDTVRAAEAQASPSPEPEQTAAVTPEPEIIFPTLEERRERTSAEPYDSKEKVEFDESKILPMYQDIYAENHDLIGWLYIPDSLIDYPVLRNKEDPEYYLTRDFYGEENVNGQLFLDEKCDAWTPSYNLVISGHNMRNGSMFGKLSKYKSKHYWEDHKYLIFDTVMREGTYVVVAAFESANYDEDEEGFRYNADLRYKTDLNLWLSEVRENQLYDTGIDVEFGDELLTLTTCFYQRKNGRFVVIARRLRKGETIE